ncbi:MAG: hypothetical protein K2H86_07050 [Muribaculaceae bacterium]|nr:hypothetical protein [Muribaculaceae bacterium]
MNIEINKETLVALYGNSNSEGRKVLRTELGEKFSEILPVTDRIKTFGDALEELGPDHEAVKSYKDIEWKLGAGQEDIKAYLKLRVITDALNEGWRPEFIQGERRWYAWYDLISQEDYEALSDEEKSRCVGRSNYNADAGGGLVYSYASVASSSSVTNYSARHAFKSEKLAEYAAKQFIEIYADFCFRPKQNKEEVG